MVFSSPSHKIARCWKPQPPRLHISLSLSHLRGSAVLKARNYSQFLDQSRTGEKCCSLCAKGPSRPSLVCCCWLQRSMAIPRKARPLLKQLLQRKLLSPTHKQLSDKVLRPL